MITLLHGDDTTQSRNEFTRLLQSCDKEIRRLEYTDDTQLTQALTSSSMFGGESVVFLENVFSKLGKKQKKVESICSILQRASLDVVIWEPKEIGIGVQKKLGEARIRLFKTPVALFKLLDSIAPNNAKHSLPLLATTIQQQPAEQAFAMIVRRIRQLIQLAENQKPDGLADWQTTRLTQQAKLFSMNQLLGMHARLLQIEISFKSGLSPFRMQHHLEQFIMNI